MRAELTPEPVNSGRMAMRTSGTFAFLRRASTPTSEKIESFRLLPKGWHYGEGGPVDDLVIRSAQELLAFFSMIGLTRTDAFAGAGSEALLAAYHRDHYIGLIIEPDGTFSLNHEVAGLDISDCEGMSLSELKSALLVIAREMGLLEVARGTWSSSDFFMPRTSITFGGNSTIFASRTSGAHSQLSAGNAWTPPGHRSAIMREGTTRP